jgi:hypothetical protein
MRKTWPLVVLLLWVGGGMRAAADQACIDQCWADYDNCPCYDYSSCNQCDTMRQSCLNQCSQCPSTRDYSTTTILSSQQTGQTRCFEEFFGANHGYRFFEYLKTYSTTNYRETTQCNGTKTTTVLSTSTGQGLCWQKSPFLNDRCSPYQSTLGYGMCL